MSTGAGPATDVPLLLEGLVDDAAIFPPGNAAMPVAVTGHLAHRRGPWRHLVGRFLCTASRLPELVAALHAGFPGGEAPIELGVVADTGLAGLPAALDLVGADPRLSLALVEIPLPRDLRDDALRAAAERTVAALPDVEGYVELPRVPGWKDALAVVADSSYGAKLRTGGLTADMFPTEAEVAAFIAACVHDETPFKCTAGLHHAVRHTDASTGFEHHGFLNVLLATQAATQGAAEPDLVALLAERDGTVLARRAAALDPTGAAVARSFFVAYGSCSIDEPVDDLTALGLLAKE